MDFSFQVYWTRMTWPLCVWYCLVLVCQKTHLLILFPYRDLGLAEFACASVTTPPLTRVSGYDAFGGYGHAA
jgi:hypothetical protein